MRRNIDENQPVRFYNRSKWLALVLVILCFIAGQIHPYFHIHHHYPHQQKETNHCLSPSDHGHHIHQCCEQHRYCHIYGKTDWYIVKININDVKKSRPELFAIYPEINSINSKISIYIYKYPFINKTFRTTLKLFNKAPPTLI